MHVDCVVVVTHFYQVFSLTELSHQSLVVFYCLFRHSLQCHQSSCYLASNQIHSPICSLAQTHQKLEFSWVQFVTSPLMPVQTLQLQLLLEATEIKVLLGQPVVQ